MPRKQRHPKRQIEALPPAAVLRFLVGVHGGLSSDHPLYDARAWHVPGRWHFALSDSRDPYGESWDEHGADLTAMAARHGFRPFWSLADGEEWTSQEAAAAGAWRNQFLAVHGRCANESTPADTVLP